MTTLVVLAPLLLSLDPQWEMMCAPGDGIVCDPIACTSDAACKPGRCMDGECKRRVTQCQGNITQGIEAKSPCEWLRQYPAFVIGVVEEARFDDEPLFTFVPRQDWQQIARAECKTSIVPQLTLRVRVEATNSEKLQGVVELTMGGMQVSAYGLDKSMAKDGGLSWGATADQRLSKGDRIALMIADDQPLSPGDIPILVERKGQFVFEPFASRRCAAPKKSFRGLSAPKLRDLVTRCPFGGTKPQYMYVGVGRSVGAVCERS